MAVLFIDGFDKYGGTSTNSSAIEPDLTEGEWTSNSASFNVVTGLSSTGSALKFTGAGTLVKTISAGSTYSRLIGGIRFATALSGVGWLALYDTGTPQCTITFDTAGTITLRTGASNGTSLSSAASITANSTHYLEWDITIGASASYQVWLDGSSLFSGTGNTRGGTSNNYATQLVLGVQISAVITYDDLYLFDSTGGTNNAVLNTNPRIETQFPSADSSVQFSFGAAVLGSAYQGNAGNASVVANSIMLRKFTTPAVTTVLNSVSGYDNGTTNGAIKYKSVLYNDSAGAPNTLLATGAEGVGVISGTTLTSAFSSGQTLSTSTQYWIGFIIDTAINFGVADGNSSGYRAANTYGSGAPNPAPAMSSGQSSYLVWGNLTGLTINYYETDLNPPVGDLSYVYANSSGYQDLYSFPALSTTPANIYTVAVKGNLKKGDTGARTVNIRMSSSGSNSSGSNSGVSPPTTYSWIDSFFDTDPHTGSAWTASGLNNATSGVQIAS